MKRVRLFRESPFVIGVNSYELIVDEAEKTGNVLYMKSGSIEIEISFPMRGNTYLNGFQWTSFEVEEA